MLRTAILSDPLIVLSGNSIAEILRSRLNRVPCRVGLAQATLKRYCIRRIHYRYARSLPRGDRAARVRWSAWLTCSGVADSARSGVQLERFGREDRLAQRPIVGATGRNLRMYPIKRCDTVPL